MSLLSKELIATIESKAGLSLSNSSIIPISGGDISRSYLAQTPNRNLFLKINSKNLLNMFIEEEKGLHEIDNACTGSTPTVLAIGNTSTESFIAMEYLPPENKTPAFWTQLGKNLAQVHAKTSNTFGYGSNNYIGSLRQHNTPCATWSKFFIECRIKPQVKLAYDANLLAKHHLNQFAAFYTEIDSLFPEEPPALVHGDLWLGNVHSSNGKSFLIDPAVYYGHREMDLAFSQMFGGFTPDFYSAYESANPLTPGFGSRVKYYNLYPTLVHLNLFGKGYLAGVENTLKKY